MVFSRHDGCYFYELAPSLCAYFFLEKISQS
jgi:hypothetical protein